MLSVYQHSEQGHKKGDLITPPFLCRAPWVVLANQILHNLLYTRRLRILSCKLHC
jgi:hypothetical protein